MGLVLSDLQSTIVKLNNEIISAALMMHECSSDEEKDKILGKIRDLLVIIYDLLLSKRIEQGAEVERNTKKEEMESVLKGYISESRHIEWLQRVEAIVLIASTAFKVASINSPLMERYQKATALILSNAARISAAKREIKDRIQSINDNGSIDKKAKKKMINHLQKEEILVGKFDDVMKLMADDMPGDKNPEHIGNIIPDEQKVNRLEEFSEEIKALLDKRKAICSEREDVFSNIISNNGSMTEEDKKKLGDISERTDDIQSRLNELSERIDREYRATGSKAITPGYLKKQANSRGTNGLHRDKQASLSTEDDATYSQAIKPSGK